MTHAILRIDAAEARERPLIDMGNVQQHVGKIATIGRYEIEVVKYLGEGGSSFIFLVRSTSSTYGGSMVLKRLLADSEASYALIESEIQMHQRFKHPQIVEYLASHSQKVPGRSGQREVFILMEYCPNGHLHDNMNKMGEKRFSQTELLRTFRSLCVPVLELHHHDPPVAHRDLKLENFLMAKSGVYKLCDFGSCVEGHQSLRTKEDRAREVEHVLKRTTAMYRSPELADVEGTAMFGAGVLTEAVDVWAMGCILYTMAFFKQPFPPEGLRTDKYSIPAGSPYSSDVNALIARMLKADVEERATLDHVVYCLDEMLDGKPLPPPSAGAGKAARKTEPTASSSTKASKPSSNKTTEARKETVATKKPAADLLDMDFGGKAAAPAAPTTVSVDTVTASFADFANFPSPTSAIATSAAPVAAAAADPFAPAPVIPTLDVPAGKRIDEFGFPVSPVKQQHAPGGGFGFGATPTASHPPQHNPMMSSPPADSVDPFEALVTPAPVPGRGVGMSYGQPPVNNAGGYPNQYHGVHMQPGMGGMPPHQMQFMQQQQYPSHMQQQQYPSHMQQQQQPGWGGYPRNGGH